MVLTWFQALSSEYFLDRLNKTTTNVKPGKSVSSSRFKSSFLEYKLCNLLYEKYVTSLIFRTAF
jgi:hypothetical protein